MINNGIQNFLARKKVKTIEGVALYLSYKKVLFTSKNHDKVNEYIGARFSEFAAFIDNAIKEGVIEGRAVRLNYTYEQEKIAAKARSELRSSILQQYNVTEEEINVLRVQPEGALDSFITRTGLPRAKIETQIRVPYLRFAIFFKEHPTLLEEALKYRQKQKHVINRTDPSKVRLYWMFWKRDVKPDVDIIVHIKQDGMSKTFEKIEDADAFVEAYCQTLELMSNTHEKETDEVHHI